MTMTSSLVFQPYADTSRLGPKTASHGRELSIFTGICPKHRMFATGRGMFTIHLRYPCRAGENIAFCCVPYGHWGP